MEVLWTLFQGIWWNVSLSFKRHHDWDFDIFQDVTMERPEFALFELVVISHRKCLIIVVWSYPVLAQVDATTDNGMNTG